MACFFFGKHPNTRQNVLLNTHVSARAKAVRKRNLQRHFPFLLQQGVATRQRSCLVALGTSLVHGLFLRSGWALFFDDS